MNCPKCKWMMQMFNCGRVAFGQRCLNPECGHEERPVDEASELRRQLAAVTKERDAWTQCVHWSLNELLKCADSELMVCVSNECGGCENDDTPPCEELCRGIVHQLETVKANELYDVTAQRDRAWEACRDVVKCLDGGGWPTQDGLAGHKLYAIVAEADGRKEKP